MFEFAKLFSVRTARGNARVVYRDVRKLRRNNLKLDKLEQKLKKAESKGEIKPIMSGIPKTCETIKKEIKESIDIIDREFIEDIKLLKDRRLRLASKDIGKERELDQSLRELKRNLETYTGKFARLAEGADVFTYVVRLNKESLIQEMKALARKDRRVIRRVVREERKLESKTSDPALFNQFIEDLKKEYKGSNKLIYDNFQLIMYLIHFLHSLKYNVQRYETKGLKHELAEKLLGKIQETLNFVKSSAKEMINKCRYTISAIERV